MTSEKRILDNRRGTVGDFLRAALRGADVFRAVTAYFSVNGFDLLSGELRGVKDSRFLFGDPSSAAEVDKDGGRQKSFLMNEGKLALRDALRQKPLAKACAEWIRGGAKIRSVRHGFLHGKMYIADSDSQKGGGAVLGSSNFTRGGLSANLEINLAVNDEPARAEMREWFDKWWADAENTKDVTDEVLKALERMGAENTPKFVYYKTLFEIFRRQIDERDESAREMPKNLLDTKIWKKLYGFQREGARHIGRLRRFTILQSPAATLKGGGTDDRAIFNINLCSNSVIVCYDAPGVGNHMDKFTVKLYDVEERAGQLLPACASIMAMSKTARDITINKYPMKMEYLSKLPDGLVLMDFSQRRQGGPGKASASTLTTGFGLEDDEGFSEQTAALYVPATQKILIQYNHSGPQAGSIATYISRVSESGRFFFIPKLRDDILAMLETQGYASEIHLSFRRGELSPEYKRRGGLAIDAMKMVAKTKFQGVAEIGVVLKKEKGRWKDKLHGFAEEVISLLTENENTDGRLLTSAKVSLSPDPEEQGALINLLKAEHKLELDGLEPGKDRLYPLEGNKARPGRKDRLHEAYRHWTQQRII